MTPCDCDLCVYYVGEPPKERHERRMAFSIVIPSRNADKLEAVVTRIREMGETARIIVADSGLQRHPRGCMYVDTALPFVFARACNDAIRLAGNDDILLLNDDALLETPRGFTKLAEVAAAHPEHGLISPAIDWIGNLNQNDHGARDLRQEPRMLCFTCVFVKRAVIEQIGLLDERYTNYGVDDDDYSWRARNAGWKLGVYDPVKVNHTTLSSEYRGSGSGDFRLNLQRFIEKFGHDNFGLTKEQSPWKEMFA